MSNRTAPAVSSAPARTSARTGRGFHVAYACLLLLVVFGGFAQTFFLRPYFVVGAPLRASTLAHGVVLTAWFLLLLAQTLLVAGRRTDLHRRLGVAAASVAALALLVFVWLAIDLFISRPPADVGAGFVDRARIVRLIRELSVFAAFPVFVGLALHWRGRPELHKRLMLLASVSLTPAAVQRLWSWPAFEGLPFLPGFLGILAALLLIPVVHDVYTRGRVHPALGWGAPGYYAWLVAAGLVMPALLMRGAG